MGSLETSTCSDLEITRNYVKRDFKTDHNATIGVEFGSKNIELDAETKIKLQIR